MIVILINLKNNFDPLSVNYKSKIVKIVLLYVSKSMFKFL